MIKALKIKTLKVSFFSPPNICPTIKTLWSQKKVKILSLTKHVSISTSSHVPGLNKMDIRSTTSVKKSTQHLPEKAEPHTKLESQPTAQSELETDGTGKFWKTSKIQHSIICKNFKEKLSTINGSTGLAMKEKLVKPASTM